MPLSYSLPDLDFERRWNEWQARGAAHERVVRRRFAASAGVLTALAIGALAGYALFGR